MRRFLAIAIGSVIVACSASKAGDGPGTAAQGGSIPCDVETVLAHNCRTCHGAQPSFGAPMSLVTYADLVAPAKSDPSQRVIDLVVQRIEEDAKPMPPAPNARLAGGDRATLETWQTAGALASDTACPADGADGGGTNPPPPPVQPLSCTPDVSMKPASRWSMPDATDDLYVCYGFDVTAPTKRHLVGIAPKIDNATIVHHLVLFQTSSAYGSTPQPCGETNSLDWRIVFGWAPGGGNFEFPPEAGYPEEGTTHYVVQIHYNNVRHLSGQTDASGFDFCTTDKLRPNDADSVVFGTTNFSIPPHGSLDISCDIPVPAGTPPVHVFSAFPHMHQLGTSIGTVQLPGGTGAPVDLGAKPHWDFQSQTYVPVSATLKGGDVVRTRCAWSNPTEKMVSFGPYTEDEMCFSFTMYYPRLATTTSWLLPAEQSKCSPTQ
jgi:hypothetical protein